MLGKFKRRFIDLGLSPTPVLKIMKIMCLQVFIATPKETGSLTRVQILSQNNSCQSSSLVVELQ